MVETEDLILNCSATGIPNPIIKWMLNGSSIQNPNLTNSTNGRTTISTITITTTGLGYSGIYSCNATSGGFTSRSIKSNTATITVIRKYHVWLLNKYKTQVNKVEMVEYVKHKASVLASRPQPEVLTKYSTTLEPL